MIAKTGIDREKICGDLIFTDERGGNRPASLVYASFFKFILDK
jgi:hypothetical protein